MAVQYLVIFLCLIGLVFYKTDSQRDVRKYIIFTLVIFILQSALRSFDVGADTNGYMRQYKEAMSMSWSDIYQNFIDVYQYGVGKDAGYPLFQKIISYILPTPRLYLFAVAIAFFTSMGALMTSFLRTRSEVFICSVWYQAMFYSFYSITGIRQVLATSFAFWAIYCLKHEKKWFYFVGLLVIGSFLHKSVLIMLPCYFLVKDVVNPKMALIASYVIFPLMFVFGRAVCNVMVLISSSDVYLMYSESDYAAQGAQVFATGLIGVSILTLFKLKSLKNEPYAQFFVYMLAIAVVFTPLAWIDPSLMRVTQYFSLFTLFLIPYIYRCMVPNNATFRFLFILLCLAIVYRHNFVYSFDW